jgi:hypothetical protein
MQHFAHFADFALTPEQQKTKESLNYLRQNDIEEFNRVNAAGKVAAKKNTQSINNKVAGEQLRLTNQYITAGISPEEAQRRAAQQANQSRAGIAKTARQGYNQKFVNSTNANQAAGTLGKIGNTAKRWGGKVAGLGGLAMTGMYVLPQIASMLPQKPQPEQEPPY